MVGILRHWRIAFSALLSAVIIATAYMFAHSVESPQSAQASTETALLQAIAAKDSDGDGLPDWEEALYGTSPNTIDTFHLGMTDGEAVAKGLVVPRAVADVSVATSSQNSLDSNGLPPPPAEGTLTDAFAKNFFTLYLSAKQANGGADLTQSDIQNVANQAIQSLSSVVTIAPDFKSVNDLTISGSGVDALATFAVSAEAVLLKNTSNATTSEINYLKNALLNNDDTALPYIASIAKAYRDSATGLAALPVPMELAVNDLMLINTMMYISEIATDFTQVYTDPLAAILALQQYPQATQSLGTAFVHIGDIYAASGISLHTGTPGASFVNLISDMRNEQATIKKL